MLLHSVGAAAQSFAHCHIRRELSVVRAQLAAVVDERNGLREDLRGVRERYLCSQTVQQTYLLTKCQFSGL